MTFSPFFVSIDFDGTITDSDITDKIIQEFASPGWEGAQDLWEKGLIGSRECLSRQMDLVSAPLGRMLNFAGKFTPLQSFGSLVQFLEEHDIPFAIVSDGFKEFIQRILHNGGFKNLPVYASQLLRTNSRVRAVFPFSFEACCSGTCKCKVTEDLSFGLPIVHIGDGRSDYCLAEKAEFVFARRDLSDFCERNDVPHLPFDTFKDVVAHLRTHFTVSTVSVQDIARSLQRR